MASLNCISVLIVTLITIIQCVLHDIEPDLKNFFLDFFNGHRRMGNLKELIWDRELEEFSTWDADARCSGDPVTDSSAITFETILANNSQNMSILANSFLSEAYENATQIYSFGAENHSLLDCFRNTTGEEKKRVEIFATFLEFWMWHSLRTFGCNYVNCEVRNVTYYACLFRPVPLISQLFIFYDSNFLSLCENEPGKWRSCDEKLQQKCLNPNASEETFSSTYVTFPIISPGRLNHLRVEAKLIILFSMYFCMIWIVVTL